MIHLTSSEGFPSLNSASDVYDYIEYLYKIDTPEFPHYKHILLSLKKRPVFLNPNGLILSGGKHNMNLIAKEKSGLKKVYSIEIDKKFINVYIQTEPRQQLADFKFYQSYALEDLF